MGEWAPLGPAADPVERPLVLEEGARAPVAKLTAVPTYTCTHDRRVQLKPLYQLETPTPPKPDHVPVQLSTPPGKKEQNKIR